MSTVKCLLNKFLNYLKEFTFPTQAQKDKELWDVKGFLKNKSNQEFKFDLRPIQKVKDNIIGKKGHLNTKADKMVFETSDKWIIIDIEELHEYLKNNKTKIVYLDKIIKEFYWNIIVNKE